MEFVVKRSSNKGEEGNSKGGKTWHFILWTGLDVGASFKFTFFEEQFCQPADLRGRQNYKIEKRFLFQNLKYNVNNDEKDIM